MKIQYLGFIPTILLLIMVIWIKITQGTDGIAVLLFSAFMILCAVGLFWALGF